MGTEALQGLASGAFEAPQNPRQTLEITPGNRQADWEEFVNMRLQDDGPYLHWIKRGGSTLQKSVTGNILTQFSFTATIDGAIKDYIAMHTDAGHAYLWEKDAAAAPTQIFTGIFTTTQQITFLANGTFLYLFDYDSQVYKVYNLTDSTSSDWMSTQSKGITSYSWVNSGSWEEENNVFGIAKGASIGVMHKYYPGDYVDPESGLRSYSSFRTEVENNAGSFLEYKDPEGNTRQTDDGKIGIFPASPDLESLIGITSIYEFPKTKPRAIVEPIGVDGGNDHKFAIIFDGVTIPEQGSITALSSDSLEDIAIKIEDNLTDSSRITQRWKVTRDVAVVTIESLFDRSSYANKSLTIEYYDDKSTFNIKVTDTFAEVKPVDNNSFKTPAIHRGYMIVDLLADGSFSMPGRPILVRAYIDDIASNLYRGLQFTIPAAPGNVEKRFLYATRWQDSENKVFDPSSPTYPNAPWFFVRELDLASATVEDYTEDDNLTQPLTADLPLTGGVFDFYGPDQLDPKSVANMSGAMIIGGWKVSRPTPSPYTDGANPDDGNAYVNQFSGGSIAGAVEEYEIGFVFEYPDGKRSDVAMSGVNLNDSEETLRASVSGQGPSATLTMKASSDPLPTNTGTVAVEFDGNQISVNWDSSLAAEDTLDEVGQKLVDEINGDPLFGITATWTLVSATEGDMELTATNTGIDDEGKSVKGGFSNFDVYFNPTHGTLGETQSGIQGENAILRSGNQVTLHSLNSLVSSVYIVLKGGTSGDYLLAKKVNLGDPEAQGDVILLPNNASDLAGLDSFTAPSGTDIQTTQDLFNWIVPAVPFQQVQISEQAQIEGQARIQRILVMQYDPDKTQMRYRLAVFTDRNLQIGYIVFGGQGITADFEIVGEGVELAHKFGAWYVGGSVVFQSRTGIHILQGNQYPIIIDKREYDVAGQDLQKVVYSREWEEYWMCFSGGSENKILAYDPAEESIRSFTWPGSLGALRIIDYAVDTMILGIDAGLYYTDLDGVHDDEGTEIQGEMITKHLGTQTTQTKILEATVAGQGYACQIALDQQKARLEGDPAVWSKDFIEDFVTSSKDLNQAGAPFQFHKRAVMPKLKIKLTGTDPGFVSLVDIKYIETANTGKARST